MNRWSAHTSFPSIGPGTTRLIFEETIAGSPVNTMTAGDEINITLGGSTSVMVRGIVTDTSSDSAVIALSDHKWKMTPRRPDEPKDGIIWTSSPTQEWVIRSAA